MSTATLPTDVVWVDAASVAPQAWRNGGGQTRELLAWPAGADWCVRISRADIERDGPFSAFPGVERWFAVLEGPGVVLTFPDAVCQLQPGGLPLRFDGAAAPGCRLLGGATQDLNLMLRHGSGVMSAVQGGQPWHAEFAMRGLYTTVAGQWNDGWQSRPVSANTLLWVAAGAIHPWTFVSNDQRHPWGAWWLGFTPGD